MTKSPAPLQYVADLLAAHGFAVSPVNDWFAVNGELPAISAQAYETTRRDDTVVARLDVDVLLEEDVILRESFAGWGGDLDAAIKHALRAFTENVFHVLLTALWGHSDEEQVTRESWDVAGTHWKATIGNYQVKASGPPPEVPASVFPALEEIVRSSIGSKSLHWVRLYYGNSGSDPATVELLLDNENHEEGERRIAALDWPSSEGFYSVRLFLIVQVEAE